MALLIPTVADMREVYPADGRAAFTLEELQGFVGGYLEGVYPDLSTIHPSERLVLFCNADGKRLNLARNGFATSLMRGRLQPGDVIVGDAILCTFTEAGWDDTDLDERDDDGGAPGGGPGAPPES